MPVDLQGGQEGQGSAVTEGWIHEIFRSVQGEGIYTGVMQVFVRMSGCGFTCSYCDSLASKVRSESCICRMPGGNIDLENPIGPEAAATFALSLAVMPGTHSISVTGGEPLEQAGFLSGFLELARRGGLPIYFETNGLDTAALESIISLVDIISLDIKLPSLCGGDDVLPAYKETLNVLRDKELFCKIVVAGGIDLEEYERAVKIIAEVDSGIPMVIQPATPAGESIPPKPELILDLAASAAPLLEDVRVIPQCHLLLGLP
jgi:organic radical activating enzyme